MYLAGNAGFMRPQAMYVRTTDRFEYGAALGLQGPNNAAALNNVEYSVAPTVAEYPMLAIWLFTLLTACTA